MLPLRSALGVVCCSAALSLTVSVQQVMAQPQAPVAPAVTSTDIYAVPDTDDEQALQLFMQRLLQTPPKDTSPEGIEAHLAAIDGVIVKVLQKKVDDEFYRNLVGLRFSILTAMEQGQNADAGKKIDDLLAELDKSPREGVPLLAKQIKTQRSIEKLPELPEAEQGALLQSLLADLKAVKKEDTQALYFHIQAATVAIEILKRGGSPLASPGMKSLIAILKEKQEPNLKDFTELLEGSLRREELVGNPMVLEGKKLDNSDFKIDSLKGKVVLVAFWSIQSDESLAEFQLLRSLYSGYQAKGFEIVGVNLDSVKPPVQEFVESQKLPWTILIHESTPELQEIHPTASLYGITSLPAMILIGADGKVINSDVSIVNLEEELEKVLGPLPEPVAP